MMQRVQSARQLLINRISRDNLACHFPEEEALHYTVEALIRASRNFKNLSSLVGPVTFILDALIFRGGGHLRRKPVTLTHMMYFRLKT